MTRHIELMQPSVNLETISDGRGGIFTYFPYSPILEWNYIVTSKGSTRGHHYHPEFDEYIMFISGHGCYVEKTSNGKEVILVGPGDCIYIPCNVSHTFEALEDCRMVALLSKKWDDCKVPIVKE